MDQNLYDMRFNQRIQCMLSKYVKRKKNWDDFIDTCIFAYNTSHHESISFSPFNLIFGRKAYLPIDSKSSPFKNGKRPIYHVKDLAAKRQQELQTAKSKIKAAQEKQQLH